MEAGLLRRSDRILPKLPGQAGRDPRGAEAAAGRGALELRSHIRPYCVRRRIAVGAWGAHRQRPGAPAAARDLLWDAAGG